MFGTDAMFFSLYDFSFLCVNFDGWFWLKFDFIWNDLTPVRCVCVYGIYVHCLYDFFCLFFFSFFFSCFIRYLFNFIQLFFTFFYILFRFLLFFCNFIVDFFVFLYVLPCLFVLCELLLYLLLFNSFICTFYWLLL